MAAHTTNYRNAFITISPDSGAEASRAPEKPGSIAFLQHAMIAGAPYRFTSDEVIFSAHPERGQLEGADRTAAWAAFFSRGQACLRASPLVKSFGWGAHHDAEGRVALFGVETADYAAFAENKDLDVIPGMRTSRKTG